MNVDWYAIVKGGGQQRRRHVHRKTSGSFLAYRAVLALWSKGSSPGNTAWEGLWCNPEPDRGVPYRSCTKSWSWYGVQSAASGVSLNMVLCTGAKRLLLSLVHIRNAISNDLTYSSHTCLETQVIGPVTQGHLPSRKWEFCCDLCPNQGCKMYSNPCAFSHSS